MKKLPVILTASLSLLLLAACSSNKTTSDNSSKKVSSAVSSTSSKEENSASSTGTSSETSEATQSSETSSTSENLTQMNISQLAAGDYSSIVGTWTNQNGNTLTFDKSGLTDGNKIESVISNTNGSLTVNVRTGSTGFALVFLPKGTSDSKLTFTDNSDTSQDRMYGTQGGPTEQQFPNEVYYKVK